MAACGLQPGRKGSADSSCPADDHFVASEAAANAKTMAKFAAAMIRELEYMSFEKFDVKKKPEFQLRIGEETGFYFL